MKLDISNIAKVYSGRIGCMCGCRGKYSYNEGVEHESWQGQTNPRSVKIIAGKVLNDPNVVTTEGDYAFVQDDDNGTIKVVYYK